MALRTTRLSRAALLFGLAATLAIVAWPWLSAHVIKPLALVIWLLLRLFVLSIDQQLYWVALVGAGATLLMVVLLRRVRLADLPASTGPAIHMHGIERWRSLVELAARGIRGRRAAWGWDAFVELTVLREAIRRRLPEDYVLHDALRDGRIPVPPHIHTFLFPAEAPPRARRWRQRLKEWLQSSPARIVNRLCNRERERLQSLSDLLSYLEDSLGMETDAQSHDRRP